jgi:hypothetical protein
VLDVKCVGRYFVFFGRELDCEDDRQAGADFQVRVGRLDYFEVGRIDLRDLDESWNLFCLGLILKSFCFYFQACLTRQAYFVIVSQE